MTRFSLCTATHALAAKKLFQRLNGANLPEGIPPDDAALAAGAAIATAIAIFKNRWLGKSNGGSNGGNGGKKFVPYDKTPQPTPTDYPPQSQLPTVRVGGFDLHLTTSPLGGVVAWVVLGGERTEIKGTSMKGYTELSKIPPHILQQIDELLDGVDWTSRKVFEVYRALRDSLQL